MAPPAALDARLARTIPVERLQQHAHRGKTTYHARDVPASAAAKVVLGQRLERLSHAVTAWTGSSWAFALAAAVIIVWLITGPLFHFSDTWQLVINTGTTIVTFLMVFLIQRTQNKDSLAIQLKLNELVAAIDGRQQPADRRRGPERGRAAEAPPVLRQARRAREARGGSREVALDRRGRAPPQAQGPAAPEG